MARKEMTGRMSGFVQINARNLVFATACLALGEIGVGAIGNANALNNQVHTTNSEQSQELQSEFFSEFWLGAYCLMGAIAGLARVAGLTIYRANKK